MDTQDLLMALQGYSARILACQERMAAINRQLDISRKNGQVDVLQPVATKRKISARSRRAIAAAQKKRWAKFHADRKAEAARQKQILAQAKKKPQRATASATA